MRRRRGRRAERGSHRAARPSANKRGAAGVRRPTDRGPVGGTQPWGGAHRTRKAWAVRCSRCRRGHPDGGGIPSRLVHSANPTKHRIAGTVNHHRVTPRRAWANDARTVTATVGACHAWSRPAPASGDRIARDGMAGSGSPVSITRVTPLFFPVVLFLPPSRRPGQHPGIADAETPWLCGSPNWVTARRAMAAIDSPAGCVDRWHQGSAKPGTDEAAASGQPRERSHRTSTVGRLRRCRRMGASRVPARTTIVFRPTGSDGETSGPVPTVERAGDFDVRRPTTSRGADSSACALVRHQGSS